ncbi:MAG: M36 family metallopeptidase [Opitutus sp.]|nr:M36 family metallopeptidase [Opitutus sp.]MCS6247779.1 M36 family metallopeptidase [Opitutus sp.]MCS6274351.1 M36 family metallopeptidase [Opitutus sp.]MCS6276776.1 M36 family metallopeptidase [Opitutus sp.]MCS6301575.1 M36 family metallopeptidase [Opitutus sp.]
MSAVALIVAAAGFFVIGRLWLRNPQPSTVTNTAATGSQKSVAVPEPKDPASAAKGAAGAAGAPSAAVACKHDDHHKELPNLDTRIATAVRGEAQRQRALAALRTKIRGVEVQFDPVTGAPNYIMAPGRFLQPAPAQPGDVYASVRGFVNEHADLFGHDATTINDSRMTREDVTAHNGMRTVVWQQQVDGIPVYNTVLKANLTRDGALVTLGSHYLSDAPASTGLDATQRAALAAQPPVDARKAVSLAAANLGDTVAPEQARETSPPEGAERRQRFSAPLLSDTLVQLAWLPVGADSAKLTWDVTLVSLQQQAMFRVVVDAVTGEVLLRTSLTNDVSNASFRVHADATTKKPFDSPNPMLPGTPTPSGAQAAEVPRQLVTLQSVNPTASPNGWINDGVFETLGNNVDAHTDTNADNAADLPRPTSATRVFDFPLDTTQVPSTYKPAAVVHLFYLNNWIHDQLYSLGFTEGAGNFQTNNFGRGGLGNDPVQADAQDGSGTNNANMSTPPDGSSPRMQMYIFTGPTPDRDGDFDGVIVVHEYVHGLSNRLVGGGVGISALATGGMGEGWSDFYGLALLADPASDPNAVYPGGSYATRDLFGMTTNYYFGIRRYPYSTDMAKNPLTFRDIDPTQASPHTGVPLSPWMGASNSNPSEVHNVGEVWCMVLWECRANLIAKYGGTAGNQKILQLVTDGMKLCPANPNLLQSRDAIIQADLVSTGGADAAQLWAAFAKRGMGAGASAPPSSTTTGVVEAFDFPDALSVTPSLALAATGPVGGPFTPALQSYTLANTSTTTPLSWTAAANAPWMSVAPAGGTLAAGASTTVSMAFNSASASLASGSYNGTLIFTNLTSSAALSRGVNLTIGTGVDYFTELFTSANDTDNQSWLFTPNASSKFYGVQRTASVSAFPTDPTGGTPLVLSDDSFVQVTPTGGATVKLYGTAYSTFYVGSNGYVTFGSGDTSLSASLAGHFNLPRVAALFADLLPTASGGSVTWKQLADRIAVSYQNVQTFGVSGSPNSFQIELFYDGQIRITCLGISNTGGLIGLSQGLGVPANFVSSNFSNYGATVPQSFRLSVPVVATEGDGVRVGQGAVTLPAVQATAVVVTLASLNTGEVTVPSSVTILAGQLSTTFDVTIVDDSVLDGTQTAIISATAAGLGSAAGAISVQDNDGTATLMVTAPPSATEGVGTVQGTVTISAALTVPVTVGLSSSDATAVQVPAGVVIPAGQTSTPFTITVVDDNKIDGTQTATLTAHVQAWSDGTASIAVLDNEMSALSVSVPATVAEGATGTGTVTLSGSLPTALVVALASNTPSRLTVPATVTLAAGTTSATFTLTTVNNTLTDGSAATLISATAAGFTNASGTTTVLDNDVHHYTFAALASAQTRGAPFAVTITAKDLNNVTISSYTTAAGLTASGVGGPVALTPATTGAFTAGIWTGNVTVNTFDSNVVLTVSDGAGHTGASTAFNVGTGALHHFVWSTQPATRTANTPVSATLTAQDAGNNTVTSFTGSAALNCGQPTKVVGTGTTTTGTLPLYTYYHDQRSQIIYLQSEIGAAGTIKGLSLNVTTLPGQTMNNWTIRMKHTSLASYATATWESTGWTTVYQANQTISTTGLTTFTFTTPFVYDGASNLMVDFSFNNASFTSAGGVTCTTTSTTRTIHYYADSWYGDPLTWSGTTNPTPATSTILPNLQLQMDRTLPISPSVTGSFSGGTWTGAIAVAQLAAAVNLRADDGVGHTGDSNGFAVLASTDASLANLVPGSGTLAPAFTSATTNYTSSASTATAAMTITPVATNAYATIQVRVNGGSYAAVASGAPSGPLALTLGANTVEVLVTAQDTVTTKTYAVVTTRRTPYQDWATGLGLSGANLDPNGDADTDGIKNLQEWAFGTNPSSGAGEPIQVNAGVLNAHGAPTVLAVPDGLGGVSLFALFGRRKDAGTVGLTYAVEFSENLTVWNVSTNTPTVIAQDSEIEAVTVPLPSAVSTPPKVFFRVRVTGQ